MAFQSVVSLHMSVLTGIFGSCVHEVGQLSEASPDVDRGWALAVVAFSFLGHILVYGPSWSFGILYITFLEEFEELPSVTAWIGTISAACTLLGGPVGSVIINRFGNRVAVVIGCLLSSAGLFLSSWATGVLYLYFTFGVMAGLGWSIAYIPLINVLGAYFSRYRRVAIGSASAGLGMGMFVYPPLLTLLMGRLHWRGTMLVIAGLNLHLLVIAAAFMPPRPSPRQHAERELLTASDARVSARALLHQLFQADVFRNAHFLCLAVNNVFFAFCISVVSTHLSNLAKSYHFHDLRCSALISAIGASNTVGRVALGLLLQHPRVNVVAAYLAAFFVTGLVTLPVAFIRAYAGLVAFAALFGFFSAAFGTLTPEVIIYICGLRRLASAYGYVLVFEAVGMVMGGPVAGWVLEAFNQYHGCFLMAGAAGIISACLMLPSWWLLTRYRSLADAGADEDSGSV